MLYFTGDMHGDFDRFKDKSVKRLRKNDFLIICGDFGFVWDNSKSEQKLLKKIGKLRFTTLFVDGTHDNIPLLRSYPAESWNGGTVRRISGNLLYLERGQIFDIDGEKLFAMGGGASSVHDERNEGEGWWQEEIPTPDELGTGWGNLQSNDFAVDYIVTHQSSANINTFLTGGFTGLNPVGEFFNRVEKDCSFKGWFFGDLHRDKFIPPRHNALFTAVVPAKK